MKFPPRNIPCLRYSIHIPYTAKLARENFSDLHSTAMKLWPVSIDNTSIEYKHATDLKIVPTNNYFPF